MNTVGESRLPGKLLLSGASGLLGAALHGELVRGGAGIVQLVRRTPQNDQEAQWNPVAAVPLANSQALEGLDAAIHLSGANLAAHRWTREYRGQLIESRVTATRAIAGTLAALRRPPKTLLVASAVGVYGDRGDQVVDEASAPGRGFLAELCQSWESATAATEKAGIRVVHLRFGVVLAAEGGALARMLPLFRRGLGGRLGSGKQWMSWITLADVVRAVVFLLESPRLTGAVNVTAPAPVTNGEFTRALARVLHRPALLPVPKLALRAALGPMADEALLASARVVPGKLLEAGFRFMQPGIEGALQAVLRL